MYAVVNIGGKQAKVEKGSLIAVEKLDAKLGAIVTLPVLMIADGERVLATPSEVGGATVTAEVLEHFKGEKLTIFKFKKRKGYKRTKGHRQSLTSVRILDIVLDGETAKPAKAAKAKAEPAAAKTAKPVEKPVAAVEPAVKAPAKVAVEAPAAEAGQCEATKSDGTQCANKAKDGSKYCGVHAKKYEG